MVCDMCLVILFFFKQKTAYEMRISDWSSDVCSSDLRLALAAWAFACACSRCELQASVGNSAHACGVGVRLRLLALRAKRRRLTPSDVPRCGGSSRAPANRH